MKYTNIDGITVGQFNEIIYELGLYEDEVYYMADFDEIVTIGGWQAIRSAYYGGRYGFPHDSFYPNDHYFLINGYNNLVSIPEFSLQGYFDNFRDEILEYANENEVELDGVYEDEDDEE